MSEEKRILAIDGGGIKGVFPTSFLATVEDSIGDNVDQLFRLDCWHFNGWNHCFGTWYGTVCQGDIGIL